MRPRWLVARTERVLYNPRPSAYVTPVPLTESQIALDLTGAMKARDTLRTSVLRGVLTAIKNARVERRGAELTEADLIQVVRREIRKREEALGFAAKAGRTDVIAQNEAELAILSAYAPAMLDAPALEQVIRDIAAAEGRSLGSIMTRLRERHAGRYDGREASEIARRVLGEAS